MIPIATVHVREQHRQHPNWLQRPRNLASLNRHQGGRPVAPRFRGPAAHRQPGGPSLAGRFGCECRGFDVVFRAHRHDAIAHDPGVRAAAGAKDGDPFKWLFLGEPGKP